MADDTFMLVDGILRCAQDDRGLRMMNSVINGPVRLWTDVEWKICWTNKEDILVDQANFLP